MNSTSVLFISVAVFMSIFVWRITEPKRPKVLPEPVKVEYVLVTFGEGVQNKQVGPKFYNVGTDPKKCMKAIEFAAKDMASDLVVMNTAFCVPKDIAEKQT